MNRNASPQLMTIEEARTLSDPRTSREAEERRQQVWAWQSVAGAMGQQIGDETIKRMEKLRLRK